MVYCDTNDSVIEWGSEEVIIPYLSPWDGRIHRYFPDFYIKIKQHDGSVKKFIIEIKPKKQCSPPEKKPKRKTKKWFNEVRHGESMKPSGSMQPNGAIRMIWNLRY